VRRRHAGEQCNLGRGAEESVDLDDDATADEVPMVTT